MIPLRVDRLPGRFRRLTRQWLAAVESRLDLAERHERLAHMAASAGQVKQANEAAETADALRDGYSSGKEARQHRLEQGTQQWEAAFGKLDSPEVQEKLAAYAQAARLEDMKAQEDAGRRAATQAKSRRSRRRGRA